MTRIITYVARLAVDPRADGALLAAFLESHDEAAFAELVRRHGGVVWAAAGEDKPIEGKVSTVSHVK